MRRSRASPSTPLCCTWAASMRSAYSAEGPAKKGFRESCSADMEDNLTLLTLDGTVNYVKTAALLRHTAALRGHGAHAANAGFSWEGEIQWVIESAGVTQFP